MDETPCLIFVALRGTGIDPHRDRLVYLTASALNPTAKAQTFGCFINPGAHLVNASLERMLGLPVGGLAQKPTVDHVLQSFFRYCDAMRGTRPVILVAQNGHHFQWPLLTQEMRRSRISPPTHYDLWDSLHAVRPFHEQGRVPSVRPLDIVKSWGYPTTGGDIHVLVTVLETLSRWDKAAPYEPVPERIYALLKDPNEQFIRVQQQNASNQFSNRAMVVNRSDVASVPTDTPVAPEYNPDFIPDPISVPEPAPVPQGVVVYNEACKWIDATYPDKTPEVLAFLELLQKRHNFGQKKYGQPLMTDDGRDDLEDAAQEMGDLFMYVTKALLNSRDVSGLAEHVAILQRRLADKCAPVLEEKSTPDATP